MRVTCQTLDEALDSWRIRVGMQVWQLRCRVTYRMFRAVTDRLRATCINPSNSSSRKSFWNITIALQQKDITTLKERDVDGYPVIDSVLPVSRRKSVFKLERLITNIYRRLVMSRWITILQKIDYIFTFTFLYFAFLGSVDMIGSVGI